MRKIIAGVLAILLLMISGTTMVFAAESNEQMPSGIVYSDLGKQIWKKNGKDGA